MSELPDCPNKSEYRYAWAGKVMHACHGHANAMKALASAMGTPMEAEPDVDGMQQGLMCEHKDDLPKSAEESN
jgi:hypothetical protein